MNISFINRVDNGNCPPRIDSRADVSSVSRSSERTANARNFLLFILMGWTNHLIYELN